MNSSKNKTKRQHYVPQFLLKNFHIIKSKGKKAKIHVFDTRKKEIREAQAVSEVFHQRYFYGREGDVEDILSTRVEEPASHVIKKLLQGKGIDHRESQILKIFVFSLLSRTPSSSRQAKSFIMSEYDLIVDELMKRNDFGDAAKPILDFDTKDFPGFLTLQSLFLSPVIDDLAMKVILSPPGNFFCISDHPIFSYNWLYRNLDDPRVTSPGVSGFQLFLPISPEKSLCFYDSAVYAYGKRNCQVIKATPSDVDVLNSFQFITAQSVVAYQDKCMAPKLHKLCNLFASIENYTVRGEIVESSENRSLDLNFNEYCKLKKMPSFVRVMKKARNKYEVDLRDPELFFYAIDALEKATGNANPNLPSSGD